MKTTKILSGMILALGLIALPAYAASIADQIAAAFKSNDVGAIQKLIASNPGQEGPVGVALIKGVNEALNKDSKLAAAAMGQVGTLCSADIDPETAKDMAAALRQLVNSVKEQTAQGKGNETDNGAIIATALSCAGQPRLVAADAGLYSEILADAGPFAGDDGVQQQLNFARQVGLRPNNNQEPTVTQTPQ